MAGVGIVRAARLITLAILIAIGIDHVFYAIIQWPLGDLSIYLDAATRLRDGQALYPGGAAPYATYWYAPWFAAAFVPLTLVPRLAVAIGWSAVLVLATLLVGWRLVRVGGRAGSVLALLVVPPLFAVAAGGNVQPLLVLALLAGLHSRAGPLLVGIAASLKITPAAFILVYVARREWGRAAVAVLVTAALWLPALPLGFPPAASSWTGVAGGLMGVYWMLYALVVVLAAGATILVPRRYAPLAAAAAAVLALPRLFVYDVTMLAVGVVPERSAPE